MLLLRKLLRNSGGASAAEYALILAVLGGVIVLSLKQLGNGIQNSFNKAAVHLNTGT